MREGKIMPFRPMHARLVQGVAGLSVATLAASTALAHHSFAKFDTSSVIEIDGEVAEINWRNPHVRLTVDVTDAAGQTVAWELETSSPGMLGRMDVTADAVRLGDRVRVAGNPAVDGSPELFATNLLLPDGQEVLLRFRDRPRWAEDQTIGEQGAWFVAEGDASAPDAGLFRVWSGTFATDTPPLLFPDNTSPSFTPLDYPLTHEARAAVEAFDPVEASATADCTPKGMPHIMEQPYNMEIVDGGDVIRFRIEEYDVVRTIHMTPDADPTAADASPQGFSMGRWEDGVLVVRTTKISYPRFNFSVPQSDQVEIVERFTPSADGARLDYAITITDPATFTEPVVLGKHWIWIEGASIEPYDCSEAG